MSEKREKSATGGEKGRKPECYEQIPVHPLAQVAKVYGYGEKKYARGNYLKGYPYSWGTDALLRHIHAFRAGEDIDPESGIHHLAHAAFHLFGLMEFQHRGIGTDDRMYKEPEGGDVHSTSRLAVPPMGDPDGCV